MYLHIYVFIYVCIYLFIYIYVSLCIYLCIYLFMYLFIYLNGVFIYLNHIYLSMFSYLSLFIYLFNRIGEKNKNKVTLKFLIFFFILYFFIFLAPTFTYIFYLLQPRMHSVKDSARGVHAAHQKKKNSTMPTMERSSISSGFSHYSSLANPCKINPVLLYTIYNSLVRTVRARCHKPNWPK